MTPEIVAILTGFMSGPGSLIILICIALIGFHLGVIVTEAIERNYRA